MEIPDQVAQLLREGKVEDAIALIRRTYFYKSPYCPKCGGKMRKDNKTGICSKCQKNILPNSKYRPIKNGSEKQDSPESKVAQQGYNSVQTGKSTPPENLSESERKAWNLGVADAAGQLAQ